MERTKSVKKTEGRKKALSYVSVTSVETKKALLDAINAEVKKAQDAGTEIGPIPTNPIPNISFWVNVEENRSGMTITRENAKWGWSLFNAKWYACKYMEGSGFDGLEFSEETTELLTSKFLDCCGEKIKK